MKNFKTRGLYKKKKKRKNPRRKEIRNRDKINSSNLRVKLEKNVYFHLGV
jgi:hypothetical protein